MNGDPTPTGDGGSSGNPILDIWIEIAILIFG